MAASVDGRIDDEMIPSRLVLEHVERRADDVVWLRYSVAGRKV